MKSELRLAGLVALAVLTLAGGCSPAGPRPSQQTPGAGSDPLETYAIGGDFVLGTGSRGFSLADHRGEAVLLFFGYTFCPDICPNTLGTLARAQAELGVDRHRTFVAFISVDPDRDTPDRLAEYVAHFGVRGAGVTGTKDEIDAVVKQYAAFYEIQASPSKMGYLVDHTSHIFLIDRSGRVRRTFRTADSPSMIAEGVRAVLGER